MESGHWNLHLFCIKGVGPGFNSRSPQQKRSRATKGTHNASKFITTLPKWYGTEVDYSKSSYQSDDQLSEQKSVPVEVK